MDGIGSGRYARRSPGVCRFREAPPMRLTRSEIRANALNFAAEWRDATDEPAKAQSFWAELFDVLSPHR